jgi:hypothetical protein
MTVLSSTTTGVILSGTITNPIDVPIGISISNSGTSVGGSGILGLSSAWTVQNSGAIADNSGSGINLQAGGSVSNSAGAVISGAANGAFITGASGTVDNSGSIVALGSGTLGAGVNLGQGGTVTNNETAAIQGAFFGIFGQGGSAMVSNAGTVVGTSNAGVEILAGGSVLNLAGGTISSAGSGVFVAGASGTINNSGAIVGSIGSGVALNVGGGVTNNIGASITGAANGLLITGAPATISNSGSIIATGTGTLGAGINLTQGGTITNNASGTLSGALFGVFAQTKAVIVVNDGTISDLASSGASDAAVELLAGGSLANLASGRIGGLTTGVFVNGGPAMVSNAGLITATAIDASFGVELLSGGTISNLVGGIISSNRTGIFALNTPAVIVNSGTIAGNGRYGVYLSAGGTLSNSGTIIGKNGTAINFAAGSSRLILNPTSVLQGTAVAAGASNVLELSGTASGTVGGLGTTYSGFQTVTIDANSLWHLNAANTVVDLVSDGTAILDSGAALTVSGALSTGLGSTGLVDLSGSSVLSLLGVVGSGATVQYLNKTSGTLRLGSSTAVTSFGTGGNGMISGMNVGVSLAPTDILDVTTIAKSSIVSAGLNVAHTQIQLFDLNHTLIASFNLDAPVAAATFVDWATDGGTGSNIFLSSVVCFAAGTNIGTSRGDVAVEHLTQGDMVMTLSSDGQGQRRVEWIGRRRIDLAAHARPETVAPIRIGRGAFAEEMPYVDLLVSPDHAIFVDGKLICARQLINGTTIQQEMSWASVEYFHVELDTHAILLANGLPAESYLDTGNRGFFANSGAPVVLHPNLTDVPNRETGSCAPFVWDEANVRPVWGRLAERAATLGRPARELETTTDPKLDIVANGRTLQPLWGENGLYIFVLPNDTTEVRLVSRAGSPTDARPWLEDRRCLGVCVERIVLRSPSEVQEVPVDHPGLSQGWWAVEREGMALHRWTDGYAALPLPVFQGPTSLEIRTNTGGMVYPVMEIGGDCWRPTQAKMAAKS